MQFLYCHYYCLFALLFVFQPSASWLIAKNNDNNKLHNSLLPKATNDKVTTVKANFVHRPIDPDVALVEDCFYDHSWLFDKSNPCHVIAYQGERSSLSGQQLKRRVMFQEMIVRDKQDKQLVRDCFDHHRDDNHESCWNISWGGRDLLGNTKLSHREDTMAKYWRYLIKISNRCRKHPWLKFEACQEAMRQGSSMKRF